MSGARQRKLVPLRRQAGVVSEMSDEALLAACSVGDTAALGALFDRHEEVVRRFVSRLSGASARDADDLVQTTFLELHRSARRFGGRSTVKTWILGVAANVVRHHTRGESRRRTLAAAWAERTPPLQARPDDEAVQRQLVARLAVAIGNLSHDLRVAFVMCDLEHVAGVEAARVLGVREGTLWRRLHDARKRLRAELEGSEA